MGTLLPTSYKVDNLNIEDRTTEVLAILSGVQQSRWEQQATVHKLKL